jgi:hypothetical protein
MFDLKRGLKLNTSMSFRATVLKRSCLAVFLLGLSAASAAFGQAANSPVAFANQDAITTSFVPAPNLAGTAGAASTAGQWFKVEVHFGTTAMLTTAFLDSVDVKVWIEGFDPDAKNGAGKGVSVIFPGTVTYVNVAAAKDIYGVFYVHPSTISRYSGPGGTDNYDRKYNVHAELSVGGAIMDNINKVKEASDPSGGGTWYKGFTVVPNLVYRQDQTPFIIADPDRYPAIKLPAAAQ